MKINHFIILLFVLIFCGLITGCSPTVTPNKSDVPVDSPDANGEPDEPPVISAPTIINLSYKTNVVSYNKTFTLICDASSDYPLAYQWYEANGFSTDGAVIVADGQGGKTNSYVTAAFTQKGIRYYYCVVTDTENNLTVVSDVLCVAYTGLPLVQINTVDGEEPTYEVVESPTGWGKTIKNATKVPSSMKIFLDGQENAYYDSGDYIKKESGLTIKIRGNTSALGRKKPYKLKLQKADDLLLYKRNDSNIDYSDKNWVLLNTGTNLNTKIGLKVTDLLGFSWTPQYEFVDVVINEKYKGSYILIESIEKSPVRIDVKKKGFIIEKDTYWYTEDVYFDTPDEYASVMKYTFKYPDSDGDIVNGDENFEYIKNYVNDAWDSLDTDTYEEYIDVDSFASWILAHDILGSSDFAGSNIFISKYDQENSKLKMETLWDFDSIFNTNEYSAIHTFGGFFYPALFDSENKCFVNTYLQKWNEIKDTLYNDLDNELTLFQNEYGAKLNISRIMDAVSRGYDYEEDSVSKEIVSAKSWLQDHFEKLDLVISNLNSD